MALTREMQTVTNLFYLTAGICCYYCNYHYFLKVIVQNLTYPKIPLCQRAEQKMVRRTETEGVQGNSKVIYLCMTGSAASGLVLCVYKQFKPAEISNIAKRGSPASSFSLSDYSGFCIPCAPSLCQQF